MHRSLNDDQCCDLKAGTSLTNNRNLDSVVELDFAGYDRHSISDWLLLLEDESKMKESLLSAHCAIAIFIITIRLESGCRGPSRSLPNHRALTQHTISERASHAQRRHDLRSRTGPRAGRE